MNTPYSVRKEVYKKGKKTEKTEWVRNSDKKKDFIEKFGEKRFKDVSRTDERLAKLVSPPLPPRFQWIWLHFLDIWRTCSHDFNGNVIFTPRTLIDYCECFRVFFSVQEKHLLFRIKVWAEDEMYQLKEKNKEK